MTFQARKENIVVQTANNETMVYDFEVDRAYLLNETSALVWQMCDGNHELSEISKALAEKTKHPANEEIVKLAIDQLKQSNLLEESEKLKDFYTKTSRRKVIRQIGVASMIALPMIFSLAAPTAARAASGQTNIGACQPCSQPSECASGNCFPNADGSGNICSNGTASPTRGIGEFPASDIECETNGPSQCCTGSAIYISISDIGSCICDFPA